AASNNYWFLAIACILGGLCQSLANPVTNNILASRVSKGRRGLIMGLKQSGVPLSQFIAGLLLPAMATMTNWRKSIIIICLLYITLGSLSTITLRFIPRTVPHPDYRLDMIAYRGSAPLAWLVSYLFIIG